MARTIFKSAFAFRRAVRRRNLGEQLRRNVLRRVPQPPGPGGVIAHHRSGGPGGGGPPSRCGQQRENEDQQRQETLFPHSTLSLNNSRFILPRASRRGNAQVLEGSPEKEKPVFPRRGGARKKQGGAAAHSARRGGFAKAYNPAAAGGRHPFASGRPAQKMKEPPRGFLSAFRLEEPRRSLMGTAPSFRIPWRSG